MSPNRLSSAVTRRWYRLTLNLALVVLFGQLLFALPAMAATYVITAAIPNFNSTNVTNFQVNGNAQLVGSAIRLTSAGENLAGSAFWKSRVSLANQRSFSSYFVLDFPNPGGYLTGGADGVVFTIQTQSNTAGGDGGGIGYQGITPSVGVEFDTWENTDVNDPNDNHVGLDVGGNITSVSTNTVLPGNLEGHTWHIWVDYQGSTKNLQVRMHSSNNRGSASKVLDVTRDLTSDIGQDVFVGFTAGTGGAYENHDVKSFYFVNDYAPIDTNPPNYYNPAPSQITAVSSVASIKTGATSTITATVRNETGAVVPNQAVAFTTNLGSLVTSSGVTNTNGQVSVTLNGGSTVGVATIRATSTGGIYATTTVAVTARTVSKIVVASSPTTIKVKGTSVIVATLRDATGIVIPNQAVTFTTNLGSLATSSAVTNASGQARVTLTAGSKAGLATIRGTAANGIYGEAKVTILYRVHIPIYREVRR